MRIDAPPISAHKLQRLHRWSLLWLKWFAAFLAGAEAFAPFTGAATKEAHLWLDRIERGVLAIVILRAPHKRLLHPPNHSSRRRKNRALLRAVIGSALRRRLRARDLRARIEALSQDIETLVACLVRRIPRGLTRRRPILARPEARAAAREFAEPPRILAHDST